MIQSFHPKVNHAKIRVLAFFILFYLTLSMIALYLICRRQSFFSFAPFLHAFYHQFVFSLIGLTGMKYFKDIVPGIIAVLVILMVHVIGQIPLLLYTRPVMLFPDGYLQIYPPLLLILTGYLILLMIINRLIPNRW